MEMHIGRIIKRLKDVEVNTEVNPREEGQAIVTKSDKIFYEVKIERDEEKIEEKETERLSEKDKDEEKEKEVLERQEKKRMCVKIKKLSRKRKGKKKRKLREKKSKKKRMRGKIKEPYEKSLPYSKKYHRKEKKFKCFREICKKLEIKIPMIETWKQGWPHHRARDSRLQHSKGRRRNQINPIPASSFLVSMSNTFSLSKIVWREEQAQASRAGAADAPAMEEEDEDDNFEDAKEGEEKDSDDSMS
ncbi:hypothetical protein LR48_Vigan11g063100 [Vigna angularis]|uniref:Uncharacterized protein n=1 Tax=Phaseolus angularis TaxID=3914 RepID=A0A0L9VRM4_PHAAN|nr:hypothetical protein LR48_Vigan11g063100 [Vigna angularis]